MCNPHFPLSLPGARYFYNKGEGGGLLTIFAVYTHSGGVHYI